MTGHDQVLAEIAAPAPDVRACFEAMPAVEHCEVASADGAFCSCVLTARSGVDLRPVVFDATLAHGWTLRELTRPRHSLEDIFMQITRTDREEEEMP
jgi:hypothetical protein